MSLFRDLAVKIDPHRVFAVITWEDLLRLQAAFGTELGEPAHPAMMLLWEIQAHQRENGLRRLVQEVADLHRERQLLLSLLPPEDLPN